MGIDNIFEKAKDIFETAYRKTENAVAHQKQKLDISSLEHKLNKSYEMLGKACYAMLAEESDFDRESLKPITDDIKEKHRLIDDAKRELAKTQNKKRCKNCEELIDNNSTFCKKCGQRVV